MNREDVRKLLQENGVAEDKLNTVADSIVAINGKDIAAEVAKTTAKEGELSKANETIKGLQKTIGDHGAEDIDGLKKKAKDWEDKYNTDIAAEQKKAEDLRRGFELRDTLRGKGVSDPDYLIFKHGGLEKFAFDDNGKAIGVDDVLSTYKESTPSLFVTETKEGNSSAFKSSGTDHGGSGSGSGVDTILSGVRQGAGLSKEKTD